MPARSSNQTKLVLIVLFIIIGLGLAGGGWWLWQMGEAESRRELVGTWELILPPGWVPLKRGVPVVIFTEDRMIDAHLSQDGGGDKYSGHNDRGTYVIDPRQQPKTIDLTLAPGKVIPGIYRIENHELTIVFAEERPTKFEKKDEQVVRVYRRISK